MTHTVRRSLSPPGAIPAPSKVNPPARQPNPARFAENEEPDLDEMLADPIFHRLLASDGLDPDHVVALIEGTRRRLVPA